MTEAGHRGVIDVATGEHLGEDEQTKAGHTGWPLMFCEYGEVAPVRVA